MMTESWSTTVIMADGLPTAVLLEPPSPLLHPDDVLDPEIFPMSDEDREEMEAMDAWLEFLATIDEMEESEAEWRNRTSTALRNMTARRATKRAQHKSQEIEKAKVFHALTKMDKLAKADQRNMLKDVKRVAAAKHRKITPFFRATLGREHKRRYIPRKFN